MVKEIHSHAHEEDIPGTVNLKAESPSVYIIVWADEFGIDPGTASGLISYSNLAYGFGSLIWVVPSRILVAELLDSDVHKVLYTSQIGVA